MRKRREFSNETRPSKLLGAVVEDLDDISPL